MKKKLIFAATAGIIAIPILIREAGLRINITDSAPKGLWSTQEAREIKRGMLVSACPPESQALAIMKAKNLMPHGDCPSEVRPLLKAVGAVSGDTVTVNRNSVSVNGEPVPNSSVIGRPTLKEGVYRVAPGEVWLFSTYVPNSFDSRYFGPVNIGLIRGEAFPVLIDGNHDDMRKGIAS